MKTVIGERLKNKSTGELYRVKKIRMQKVLLEAENGPHKGWYGDDESLELFYEKLESQKG